MRPAAYSCLVLDPEMAGEDLVVLLATVPERLADLVAGLDEQALSYRHAPAFPTLKELICHLCRAGVGVDAMLRQAYLDGARELHVRETIDPVSEPELSFSPPELLEDFARVRRRTVDLLRGLSTADWKRVVVDPKQGELTLQAVCGQIAQHEFGHLAQIRNLVALLPDP